MRLGCQSRSKPGRGADDRLWTRHRLSRRLSRKLRNIQLAPPPNLHRPRFPTKGECLMASAAPSQTTVGLVQINRALNLSRQRFKGRRQPGGIGVVRRSAGDGSRSLAAVPLFGRHAAGLRPGARLIPGLVPLPAADPRAAGRSTMPWPASTGADVVGFSVYVWNIELSLAIARALKARRPATLIVFGGPQVPDRAEAFLRHNPADRHRLPRPGRDARFSPSSSKPAAATGSEIAGHQLSRRRRARCSSSRKVRG